MKKNSGRQHAKKGGCTIYGISLFCKEGFRGIFKPLKTNFPSPSEKGKNSIHSFLLTIIFLKRRKP